MLSVQTLSGKKIGTFTILNRERNESGDRARFACVCECGKKSIQYASDLIAGTCSACGCVGAEEVH